MENDQPVSAKRSSSGLLVPLISLGTTLCLLSFFSDGFVSTWVETHQVEAAKHLAWNLSRFGDWPELMLFGFSTLTLAGLAKRRQACKLIICMIIASTVSGALVNSVRVLSGRARPSNKEATQEWNGVWHDGKWLFFKNQYHAFPSGHTGAAFGFFGLLVFARRWYGWALLLVAGAIAWSRIYLDAHHLSDVMVGALLGLLSARFVWVYIGPWVEKRFLPKEPAKAN